MSSQIKQVASLIPKLRTQYEKRLPPFNKAPKTDSYLPKKINLREKILFTTLTIPLDYQRQMPAERMWRLSKVMWRRDRWTFDTKKVLQDYGKLIDVFERYGFTFIDAAVRFKLARSLMKFNSDPIEILKANKFDAYKIYEFMKSNKDFPFLKGEKILPFWLRMMYEGVHIPLCNLGLVPPAIDIHVARTVHKLGLLENVGEKKDKKYVDAFKTKWNVSKEIVKLVRRKMLELSKISKIPAWQMDEPFWWLDQLGCSTVLSKTYKTKTCKIQNQCLFNGICI